MSETRRGTVIQQEGPRLTVREDSGETLHVLNYQRGGPNVQVGDQIEATGTLDLRCNPPSLSVADLFRAHQEDQSRHGVRVL